MIGQTVSHYRIISRLGAGGMGVVYKAEDLALERFVALKFLPPHLSSDENAKKRFIHEAKAASALEHPAIGSIHEIDEDSEGRTFIVMPCYEGTTLDEKLRRGPLDVDEALAVAAQVASGLAKAHEKGIVHRDIKPGNVFITGEGHAKILDFGLAKLAGQTKLTKTGMTVGTLAYMSPEQVKGEQVDHRTDIWSLGVMLYEMLTGRSPFKGDVEPALLYSVLNQDPEPLTTIRSDMSVELEDIVERALAKRPEKRYETADELLSQLEHQRDQITLGMKERRFTVLRKLRRRKRLLVGAAVVATVALTAALIQTFHSRSTAIASIAVLPFVDLSGDKEQEYFSDGMTAALINELGQIGALRVISRTSVMQFRNTEKTLPKIAKELDVDAVVEASVLRSGGQVLITVQLIRADPERQMWAESYERDLQDVLLLCGELARAIADRIKVAVTPQEEERLARVRSVNPEAYELYLKGMHHYEKWTKEGFEKAIEYFQQAIEIEPNYARAYDGLADCYGFLGYSGVLSLEEARSRMNAHLQKALEIDDKLAEAHETMAGIKHYYDWDWVGAETGYKRAIELNPNLVEAHLEYAVCLADMGRSEEAIAEAKRAVQLDPLSIPANRALGYVYYWARRFDQAIAHYQQMAELEPNESSAYRGLARTYAHMGRFEDAVRARQKALTVSGAPPERMEALGRAYGESGPEGYWMWCLEGLEGRHDRYPAYTSMYYAQLGEKEKALALLETAYERHDGEMHTLKTNPYWDPLRDDARFHDLLRRMNFPENQTQNRDER